MPVDGVRRSLWRASAVFRIAGLAVAVFLIVREHPHYARPALALLVAAAMLLVTAVVVPLSLAGRMHRTWPVLADVVITAGLTATTRLVQTPAQFHGGMVTVTTVWGAGPTLEAAFVAGTAGGVGAGVLQYLVTAAVAETIGGRTLYTGVLLVLAGGVVGLVTGYAVRAEDELRVAAAARASLAERERLARSIHDGVLQVLGLVHRTGQDAPEPWAALAIEAATQEAALRALITSAPAPSSAGPLDLGQALRSLRTSTVTVSTPAEAAMLPDGATNEVVDAVRAALANVERHAGPAARSWVVLEILERHVAITVRDDGAGFAPGRLEAAEREGRIGVARSVRGRIEAIGGRCEISSAPGEGTTIEMRVPCV